jgi:imidazolonepropionase-like amidohydrolase
LVSSATAAPPVAYRGARILTAAGKTFDPGTLVTQDGKIVAVGPLEQVAVPEGAAIVDVAGKVIIPGLVDTHSHLGVYSRLVPANSDGNEMTGPAQSVVRALDA